MTTRELYNAVINTLNEYGTDGAIDLAVEMRGLVSKLDERNEKRKSAESKEKREVRARVDAVKAFLMEHVGEQFTRDAIAEGCGITAGQAQSACKALGEIVTKSEVKIDKARRVVYSIAE